MVLVECWLIDICVDICVTGTYRTPRLTQGEAYYKRILGTNTYSIFSAGREQHSHYVWNATMAEKGVNNVISAEYDHHTKCGTGAKHLFVWFDACAGQCANWVLVMFHCLITDPSLQNEKGENPYMMYERLDSLTPLKGHTYLENDRGISTVVRESNNGKWKTISDYRDWMQITRDANQNRPHRVVEFEQSMHYDWATFLSQIYVRGRKDISGVKAKLLGARWRSYGASEEKVYPADGGPPRVELVEHPGEVWIRYSLDDDEPWTKIDMRRWASKLYQGCYNRDVSGTMMNIGTDELPFKEWIADHTEFQLYSGPRPISPAKKKDLVYLCRFLPEEKREYYMNLLDDDSIIDSGKDEDDLADEEIEDGVE